MTDERIEKAKRQQDYDSNPPRCCTCLYFKREPLVKHIEREVQGRSGRTRIMKVSATKDRRINPIVDRCTFGNFLVSHKAVCDEWRDGSGERIINKPPTTNPGPEA